MLSEPTADLKIQHHAGPLSPKFLWAFRSAGRGIKRAFDALLPLLALASAVEARAEDPEWFVVEVAKERTTLMNKNILPGNRAWTAIVLHPGYEHEMDGKTTILMSLTEFDCRNRTMRTLYSIGRDDEGQSTGSERYMMPETDYVIPGTIGEDEWEYACKVAPMPTAWLSSPSELRKLALETHNELEAHNE